LQIAAQTKELGPPPTVADLLDPGEGRLGLRQIAGKQLRLGQDCAKQAQHGPRRCAV
jgi:hypothetical protein